MAADRTLVSIDTLIDILGNEGSKVDKVKKLLFITNIHIVSDSAYCNQDVSLVTSKTFLLLKNGKKMLYDLALPYELNAF